MSKDIFKLDFFFLSSTLHCPLTSILECINAPQQIQIQQRWSLLSVSVCLFYRPNIAVSPKTTEVALNGVVHSPSRIRKKNTVKRNMPKIFIKKVN